MNDRIFINDIEIFAKHGVFSEEKRDSQRFLVSITAKFDATHAKAFDQVCYTIDYSKLLDVIIIVVQKSSFNLLEKLAAHLAEELFNKFELLSSLDITIKKFPVDLTHRTFSSLGFSGSFCRDDKLL